MDLASPFKTDVLRPLATLAFPGLVVLAPYTLLAGHYVPPLQIFWEQHPTAFGAVFVLALIAVGFIIDEIGAQIELNWWDRLLAAGDRTHTSNWYRYLKLQLSDELVAHRYLRHKVTQLKFELAVATALPMALPGILWLNALHEIWAWGGIALISTFNLGLSAYLLYESWMTAGVLSRTRALILEAFDEGVRGIKKEPPVSGR